VSSYEKCSLGDVVVSTKVVGYEPARKEIEEPFFINFIVQK
jgi:hypothetical protein